MFGTTAFAMFRRLPANNNIYFRRSTTSPYGTWYGVGLSHSFLPDCRGLAVIGGYIYYTVFRYTNNQYTDYVYEIRRTNSVTSIGSVVASRTSSRYFNGRHFIAIGNYIYTYEGNRQLHAWDPANGNRVTAQDKTLSTRFSGISTTDFQCMAYVDSKIWMVAADNGYKVLIEAVS